MALLVVNINDIGQKQCCFGTLLLLFVVYTSRADALAGLDDCNIGGI